MKTCREDDCDRKHWARGLCSTHYAREWRRRNPERVRATARRSYASTGRDGQLRRLYGVTADEVDAQREAQGFRCALCRLPEEDSYNGLHVDHDHETGRTRALLCRACNVGLGKFRDDPALLRLAADYVEWGRR